MIKNIKNFLSQLFTHKVVAYVGTVGVNVRRYSLNGAAQRVATHAVYKCYDPITGKIYKLWAQGDGNKVQLNVDAYERDNLIITK